MWGGLMHDLGYKKGLTSAEKLATGAHSNMLTSLYLNNCNLTDKGAEAILTGMRHYKKVQVLRCVTTSISITFCVVALCVHVLYVTFLNGYDCSLLLQPKQQQIDGRVRKTIG